MATRLTVAGLIVDAFIGSLNVRVTTPVMETPVAPAAGDVETTVGSGGFCRSAKGCEARAERCRQCVAGEITDAGAHVDRVARVESQCSSE